MDTLMQKIQRNSDLSDRQSLIIEHMKLMDIYLSSLEKRIPDNKIETKTFFIFKSLNSVVNW